jgi:hypothetical protein
MSGTIQSRRAAKSTEPASAHQSACPETGGDSAMTNSRYNWPIITMDSKMHREWVHLIPPEFYLHQIPKDEANAGKWVVIYRPGDFAVTKPFKTRLAAARSVIRNWNKDQTTDST